MNDQAGGQKRLYRSLLRAYPAEYRSAYGQQMVQLFGDQLRDEGSLQTWLRTAADLPRSAASERVRRNRTVAQTLTVAPTPVSRILGVLGVVGGVVLLSGFLTIFIQVPFFTADYFNLRLVLFNLGAIAVVIAVHMRQSPAGPRLALVGAVPAVLANAAFLVLILLAVAQPGEIGPGDYGPWFNLVAGVMWLADACFGVVTFRLGVMSRISSMALTIGSIASFVGMGVFGLAPIGSLAEQIILVLVALHGLAWVLLGLEVAFRRRPAAIEQT